MALVPSEIHPIVWVSVMLRGIRNPGDGVRMIP